MGPEQLIFGEFTLDPRNRELRREGERVELGGRYLDALVLLAREPGALVTKDRFMQEVWRGVPVTDEALTQCIRSLRQALGDNAASPRFIATVPRHGYRFIAPVEREEPTEEAPGTEAAGALEHPPREAQPALAFVLRGALGAGAAGLVIGLAYGLAGARGLSSDGQAGGAALSMVLVLTCVSMLSALVGGAGICAGLAASHRLPRAGWLWTMAAGALGGTLMGAFAQLLGLDAFLLLVGRAPGRIAGASEGALLGAAIGLGLWLARVRGRGRRDWGARDWGGAVRAVPAALLGALAGLGLGLGGGTMMGGSLQSLIRSFPQSRFRLDAIGALMGEEGFGPVARAVTGAAEGALFAGCIVAALVWKRRA